MLSRRAFLERGSLALAAMSLHAAHAAEAPTGPLTLGRPIGLQIYTVREAVAKDLPGTLRALADIGYREVELAGMPTGSAKELRKLLSDSAWRRRACTRAWRICRQGCRSASTTRRRWAPNTWCARSRGPRTRASAPTPVTQSCRSPRASRSTTGSGTPSS